jgi:tape measure domain-containing protein
MAQNIVFRVVADTQPAVDGMNKLDSATKNTKKDVSGLDDALGKIGGMVAGAFAVERLIAFGKEVLNVTKQFESIQIRLNSIAGGAIEGQKAMDDLRMLANKLGLEFKGLANEYAKFVGAAKASGIEVAKADKIFKSMSVAIAGSGASAEQSNRAFIALTQMMGKGKISAEELRGQLGEALPSAFGIMAKSMGVTTAQLDKMMANGELMASEVLPKFATEMERAFRGDAEKLADGLQGSLNRLTNAWDSLMLNIGNSTPFDVAINGLTGLINAVDRGVQVLKKGTTEAYLSGKKTEQTLQAQAVIKNINQKLDEKQLTIDQKKEALNKLLETGQKKENELLLERGKVRAETKRGGAGYDAKRRLFDLFELVQKQQVYNDALKSEIKVLDAEAPAKEKSNELTEKQIKAIEKERLERIKLKREMEKALKDVFNVDFSKELEDPNLVGPPKPDAKYFRDARDQRQKEEDEKLKQMRSWQSLFETEQGKLFANELSELDRKHRMGKIKEEDYLKELLKLHKKYGVDVADVEDKITLTDFDKKQTRKAYAYQMAGETASAVTNTILSYKQKEIDGEKEMVENQRQQGLISQEQYDQQIRAIKRKEAIADRIAAIAQIAINTAIAITNPTNAASALTLTPLYLANAAIQTGIVLAQPLPYNKGTKRVPMMRGAMRGRDSVHAILTPDERVVPADINTQPGYSALLDLAQDKKISDKEAGFLAELATSGMRRTNTSQTIDPDTIGRAIAKYIPHTNVAINERGIAVITERSQTEIRRLRRRIS